MKKLICLLVIVALSLIGCGERAVAPVPVETQTPAVEIEKEWVVTNTFEGNTRKETESFKVSNNTRVSWEVDEDNKGFMLGLKNEKGEYIGGEIASVREGAGKELSYVNVEPGEYHLAIVAGSKYKVVIEQQQ